MFTTTPLPTPTPTVHYNPMDDFQEGAAAFGSALAGTLFHWLMIVLGFGAAAIAVFILAKRTPYETGGKIACVVVILAGSGFAIWQWMRQYERITGAFDEKVTGEFPLFLAGWPLLLVIVGLGFTLFNTRGRSAYGW